MHKKQIILIRHAHAVEKSDFSGQDFDRPLTDRGRASIAIMTNYLRLIGVKPDRVFSSGAVRSEETADVLSKKFFLSTEACTPLYAAAEDNLEKGMTCHFDLLRSLDEGTEVVVIVGHNPGLTEFARKATGQDIPNMKKGSIVVLALPEDVTWKNFKKGDADFIYYNTPQFLRLEELSHE